MTKRKRQRRDKRQINPVPIRITERDMAVLQDIYAYRVMSTEQIQTLHFPSRHRAYERLASLYNHGFLDRRFLGQFTDKMNKPILYVIDRAGIELLRSHLGMTIEWNKVDKSVTPRFLHHALAIGDIRVAVTKACEQTDNVLLDWQGESDLKQDYDYVSIRNERGRMVNVSLIPDSYFCIATAKGDTHFFVEMDRGTMELARFKQKIVAYIAYYQSGLSERRFGTKHFRVLTVTESKQRGKNLKRVTEDAGGKRRFWFSVLSELNAENILNEVVWQVADDSKPASLISW